MAYDKVVDSAFLEAGLTLVGDSIRAKGGTSAKLEFPNGMKAAVDAIDTSENLDEVLDEQDSIIDQIQAALEGKAGVSIECDTCTVEIKRGGEVSYLWAEVLVVKDGKIERETRTREATDITINDVLCGSIFMAYGNGGGTYYTSYGGSVTGMTALGANTSSFNSDGGFNQFFRAPTIPNGIGTVVIAYNEK